MKLVALTLFVLVLVACAEKEAAGSSQNEQAATACEVYAKGQLAEKTYQLDHAALATSLAAGSDGVFLLKAPITIDPGLSSESKQSLECTVRFVEGHPAPDVINMQFIW
jgi:hypothetical protein